MPFGDNKEMKEVSCQNSAEDDLSNWCRKSNLKGGRQDLVVVFNDLKLSVKETGDKRNIGKIVYDIVREKKQQIEEICIDPMTGEYDFSDE